jgi:hypothetical protein
MMVWVDLVSVPKHSIALINLVYAPKKLAFEDYDFDVVRIFL